MRCLVCSKPSLPGRWYCARCYPYFVNRHDNLKRRTALREAYDPGLDGFLATSPASPSRSTTISAIDGIEHLLFEHGAMVTKKS